MSMKAILSKAGQVLGELDHAPYENALMQAKAGVSVAQAQYDLMLAGYRDEEIAQAAAAVRQAQAAMTTRKTFITASKDCGKAAPFPLTIWKMPAHRAIRHRRR
ncbi:HlyD family secretion protein [Salmonella enterica subsp. enterica serovar Sanjuan]|uniref:HlyD family secretion protein n=1 Tax=Salmonella enterica subsp. enterica serovar Sanjuan TaxID=1160765 RepID=A0A3S4H0T6_SALET|nr:HlyD family secretion protein [Salmonella enterica subsp. enterica serovar Sanjuan]